MNAPSFSRRQFGRGLLAAGALGGFGSFASLVRAIPRTDQHFIFCHFHGGWDVLLGLDSRAPLVFTDDRKNTTRIELALGELSLGERVVQAAPGYTPGDTSTTQYFGPFMGHLLDPELASRLCVVRGMSMDTLSHDAGRRRFLTGRPPSGELPRGSNISAYLANTIGPEDSIPNLAARVEQFNPDLPATATALSVSSLDDLLRLLRPGGNAFASEDMPGVLSNFQRAEASCGRARHSDALRRAELGRARAEALIRADLGSHFDFANDANGAIARHFGLDPRGFDRSSPEALAAMTAQALTKGLTHVVNVRLNRTCDTHFDDWAEHQGPNQEDAFNLVAKIAHYLSSTPYTAGSGSWLDHTTIVGFSEFSRSPLRNPEGGRGHHLTNSCFLLGALAKGGTSVGASSDFGMEPQPVNLVTGAVDFTGGHIVRPEHVLRGLLSAAGVTDDIANLGVAPLTAAFASTV